VGQAGAGHALLEQTRGEEKTRGEESVMGRDGSKKEGRRERWERKERGGERTKRWLPVGDADGCAGRCGWMGF